MRRSLFVLCFLACACGGPEASDGGTDAGVEPERDAGTDAGPPPTGCALWTGDAGTPSDPGPLPDPADFPPPAGPGAPAVAYEDAELLAACAYLPVGPSDENHHNTGFFLDGYLVRPWAHERGRGGVAVWDFDDPCNPELVANVLDDQIRETHATGLSNVGGRWIAVASLSGVQIWDASDVTAMTRVTDFALPNVVYPDSYMNVIMSVFWQAPYLYLGASNNGVYIVDASDPLEPRLVAQFTTVPQFRVGQVVVVGTLLFAFSSEGAIAGVYDVSEPAAPRAIPGGTWRITDGTMDRFGRPSAIPAYFGHVNGWRTYHPLIALAGGLAIFDLRTPRSPQLLGAYAVYDGADGGYVFLHEGVAFLGLSSYGVSLDVSDPSAPALLSRFELTGDLDTVTPFGNVAVVSVDDDATPGQASAVVPFARDVDSTPPEVNMVVPDDGATDVAITARVGMTFTEFVEMSSVWRGSVIVREVESGRAIEGHLSGQEGVVSFWPTSPLAPSTTYEVLVPAGGVTDLNGNAIAAAHRSTFTTVACE